jgi:hypothetical protein
MEKKFLLNLQAYLAPLVAETVVIYDSNSDHVKPFIGLGIAKFEVHPVLDGCGEVEGEIVVCYNGTQDPDLASDDAANVLKAALRSSDLTTALNAPVSGIDGRPGKPFHLEELRITGTERVNEDLDTYITIFYSAFIADVNG